MTTTGNTEYQDGMDYLKTQNEITVIDIPEQTREAKKEEKKRKHVNIFKQFFILKVYITAVVAYFSYLALNIIYSIFIQVVFSDEKIDSTNQQELESELKSKEVSLIIIVCVIGPIIEEFIFRGIIFKLINWFGKEVQKKFNVIGIIIRILAFVISSFIFAFGHFAFSFETLSKEIKSFPIYFMMGIIFALAYDHDGYILASILTHIITNTISVLILFYVIPQEKVAYIVLHNVARNCILGY